MRYLENPEPDTKQTDDEFKYSSKVTIINCAKIIMKRNFQILEQMTQKMIFLRS
jgi:hypothetical protein